MQPTYRKRSPYNCPLCSLCSRSGVGPWFLRQIKMVTPYVTTETITAAMRTPSAMAGNACFRRISNTAATSEPVHAPVPGSGIATRMHRPSSSYFFSRSSFAAAFFSSRDTSRSRNALFFLSHSNARRVKRIRNGTGKRFPIIAVINTIQKGRPAATPTGIAPRSSNTGTIASPNTYRRCLSRSINYFPFQCHNAAVC